MWHCSSCGEAIQDNFDACWRCGTQRDEAVSEELQEESEDPSSADSEAELLDPDDTAEDEMTPARPPERALTREGLATVLLRFLGLCLTVFGILGGIQRITYRVFSMQGHDIGDMFWDQSIVISSLVRDLIYCCAELLIGLYFLIGGQWVYDKILAPVSRSWLDDGRSEGEEDDLWRTWKSGMARTLRTRSSFDVTGETIRLQKEDGSTISVERSKLSESDWNWVTRHTGRK